MSDKTDLLLETAEPLATVLMRCQTVLHNMALENEGFLSWPRRWPIHHEPLRADAKNLLPLISDALSAYHKAFMALEMQVPTIPSSERAENNEQERQ